MVQAGHDVRVWTARPDTYISETQKWLAQVMGKDVACCIQLRMRSASDDRPTNEIKGEWLDECGDHPPDVIFDDRNKCVDYWRSRGITCCQVANNT